MPLHSNRSKRFVKTPKLHVCDSGLAAALADLRSEQWNPERTRFGHLLESFVIQQVLASGTWHASEPRFGHYRDKDLLEVDLVIEVGSDVWGIEVKAGAAVQASDGRGLMRLADVAKDKFRGGLILYDGEAVLPVAPHLNIHAAPIAKLWEF